MASSADPDVSTCSWMSLCMAATSKLMDEKLITQSDATTDAGDEESAVTSLLCFESIESSPVLSTTQRENESTKRKGAILPEDIASKKVRSPSKYIRGIPAISKRDAAWNVMFRRLQEFKHDHGHCNVPQGYAADLELATWVKNQRQAYRYMLDKKADDKKPTKRISPDRVTRLNHLGFEWRKYTRSEEWKPPKAPRQKKQGKKATHRMSDGLLPTLEHVVVNKPPTRLSTQVLCEELAG